MPGWGATGAERYKSEQVVMTNGHESVEQVQERLQELAPGFWLELREWIIANAEEFNRIAGERVLAVPVRPWTDLQVFARNGRRMKIEYDTAMRGLRYNCGDFEGRFSIVFGAGERLVFADANSAHREIEDVGKFLLDLAMGWTP